MASFLERVAEGFREGMIDAQHARLAISDDDRLADLREHRRRKSPFALGIPQAGDIRERGDDGIAPRSSPGGSRRVLTLTQAVRRPVEARMPYSW